jgi:hypothetical protein
MQLWKAAQVVTVLFLCRALGTTGHPFPPLPNVTHNTTHFNHSGELPMVLFCKTVVYATASGKPSYKFGSYVTPGNAGHPFPNVTHFNHTGEQAVAGLWPPH